MGYRTNLTGVYADEVLTDECYNNADDVKDMIDDIEEKVKDIISLLDDIKGISEIDNVKDELAKLAKELY